MNLNKVLNYALNKVSKAMRLTEFPNITNNGNWETTKDAFWTGGFWIGLLWWMYKSSGDKIFKEKAYYWLDLLEKRKKSKTFDLGFLFYPSYVLGYKITQDKHLKEIALEAADTLLTTYNEKMHFMYDEKIINDEKYGEIIIDIMPNLSLLWWAYKETRDKKYYNLAYVQSKGTIKELIRKDFSTIQAIIFDLKNYEVIKKGTFQGYNDDSCWSRGQAWGLYGYICAYKATKEIQILDIAQNLGMYFISNLPEDFVPYWDLNVSDEPYSLKDSSAASIASSGLLEIYKYTNDEKIKNAAMKILESLSSNYLTSENKDGILAHGCFYMPKNLAVDESLIWGDYYFVEALMKIKYNKLKI